MSDSDRKVPILLWPFYAIWRLLTLILNLVGRLFCGMFGLSLLAVGVTMTMTVIAAPIGIAIGAFGFLLLVRSLF